tara:strand:- start:486 stop:692 length:207 start_codon:yes stop_codon:yes gene_type:complete
MRHKSEVGCYFTKTQDSFYAYFLCLFVLALINVSPIFADMVASVDSATTHCAAMHPGSSSQHQDLPQS